MTRFHNKSATSWETTQKRISDDDLEPPLRLSDDLRRVELDPAQAVGAPPSGGTLADMEAWARRLWASLHVGGIIRG